MGTTPTSVPSPQVGRLERDALARFEGEGGPVAPDERENLNALELREDESLEGRTHHAQRIAWLAFAAMLLLALAGAFGPGLLLTRAASRGDLTVHYDATIRAGTPARWRLVLPPPEPGAHTTELFLSSSFVDHVDLTLVEPTPTVVAASRNGVTLAFEAVPNARPGPFHVSLAFEPLDAGDLRAALAAGDSGLAFHQWVWP